MMKEIEKTSDNIGLDIIKETPASQKVNNVEMHEQEETTKKIQIDNNIAGNSQHKKVGNTFFCTNCGKAVGNLRICSECHLSQKKNYKKFCKYCGGVIEVTRCSLCNMPSRTQPIERLARIINTFVILWLFIISIFLFISSGAEDVATAPSLFLGTLTILYVFLVFKKRRINSVKRKTIYKKFAQRILLLTIYIVIPISLFAGSIFCINLTYNNDNVSNNYEVYAKTQAVAHLRGRLKNPDSLKVNRTSVKLGVESSERCCYYVAIDYSAQNGFGGYNREINYAFVEIYKDIEAAMVKEITENQYEHALG